MTKIDLYINQLKKSESKEDKTSDNINLQQITELVGKFPEKALKQNEYTRLLELTKIASNTEQPKLTAQEQLKLAQSNAAKLAILFGTYENAVNYLLKYEKNNPNRDQLLHDACLFSLPEGNAWKIKLWQTLAEKHMPSDALLRAIPFASKIESHIEKNKDALVKKEEDQLLQEYELRFSEEYDQQSKKTSSSEEKLSKSAEKEFQAYLKKQLQIDLYKKPSPEQFTSLTKRIEQPTQADLEKRKQLLGSTQSTSPNQTKQQFIEKKLAEEKKAITAKIQIRISSILSETTPLEKLASYAEQVAYQRKNDHPRAAKLFFTHGIPESEFNKYLELKISNDDKLIPKILLDGEKFGHKNVYIKKLEKDDPRCAILGKLTSCCQSLGQNGEIAAVHGITSPRGGFYVLCRKSASTPQPEDDIVAQCWAWRGRQDFLVFDSI